MGKSKKDYIREPSVLILHEKHGSLFFYVPDDAALFKAALEVVKGRARDGYRYCEPEAPGPPPLTKEQVEALPEAMMDDGRKKRAEHLVRVRRYQDEKDSWDNLQRLLASDDGEAAWVFLHERRGWEYERVSLERLQRPGTYRP